MAVPNRRSSSSSTSSSLKSPNTEMRRSILRKIRKTCYNEDSDPISGLTWQEMSNDQLRTLIRLGEGKKKHCFSMESLQGLVEHSRRHGIDIKNPNTRANLTAAEIRRIDETVAGRYFSPVPPPQRRRIRAHASSPSACRKRWGTAWAYHKLARSPPSPIYVHSRSPSPENKAPRKWSEAALARSKERSAQRKKANQEMRDQFNFQDKVIYKGEIYRVLKVNKRTLQMTRLGVWEKVTAPIKDVVLLEPRRAP